MHQSKSQSHHFYLFGALLIKDYFKNKNEEKRINCDNNKKTNHKQLDFVN